MRLIYSGTSLSHNKKKNSEIRTIEKLNTPSTVEQLQEQIEYLTERVKQLEIEQAWNQKSSLLG